MCQTCNDTGAVQYVNSSMIIFQPCLNCSFEERKAREERFYQIYEKVKKKVELQRQIIIQELERKQIYETPEGRSLNELSLDELEVARVRLPELKELIEIQEG